MEAVFAGVGVFLNRVGKDSLNSSNLMDYSVLIA
jgi:hypothetical protein